MTTTNQGCEGWRTIESAPMDGSCERILLRFADDNVSVGYWDLYYAEGGRGCSDGHAWIEPCSGEQLNLHYDLPTHWMPIAATLALYRGEVSDAS
jgi:hypothetical protein